MIFEGSIFVLLFAFGLTLVLFVARTAKREKRRLFKKYLREGIAASHFASGRMFEKNRLLLSKKCPNCAAQLPLPALFCEACEYNFLSGAVGLRNKALPAPEAPPEKAENRIFARLA